MSGNQTKSVLNETDILLAVFGKDPEENVRTHCLAFYSHQAMSPIKTDIHLLSLIPEPVTTPATCSFTQKLMSGQNFVISANQPIYAIEKQLQ